MLAFVTTRDAQFFAERAGKQARDYSSTGAAGTSVPIGTIIDATLGRAQLTTAADTASHTQETGVFFGGVFRLEQTTLSGAGAGNALTMLKLVGPLPACLVKKFGKKAAITAAKRRTRKLWGQAKGNFRTVGRYAAATVRGTKWLTEDMCAGTLIEYRLRLHGIPLRWVSRITVWEPGRRFVDRQLRGPYRLWEHLHEVFPHPEGTLSRDRVDYSLPLGPLGVVANHLVVRRDLERIFDFRHEAIARLLGPRPGAAQ